MSVTQVTNIYIHNSSLANGANDNSYRYAGSNPNNYVCFGSDSSSCPNDNLYRIIGVFGSQVKLIKADYANSDLLGANGTYNSSTFSASSTPTYKGSLVVINKYAWTKSTNAWSSSVLNTTNLNTNYITYLNNQNTKWANKIAESIWKVGGNTWANIMNYSMNTAYQKIVSPAANTTHSAKIGLMYVSDYGYSASPKYWTYVGYNSSDSTKDYSAAINDNWMYLGLTEWTIMRVSNVTLGAFFIYSSGYVNYIYMVVTTVMQPALHFT